MLNTMDVLTQKVQTESFRGKVQCLFRITNLNLGQ